MNILLPWKITEEEKEYLSKRLDDLIIEDITSAGGLSHCYDRSSVEVLVSGLGSREVIEYHPNLRFIQSMIAGVSHIDLDTAKDKGIIVASAKGANSYFVAEHALMLAMGLLKRLPGFLSGMAQNSWDKNQTDSFFEKNICVVGYGNIGREIIRLSSPFEFGRRYAVKKRPSLRTYQDESLLDGIYGPEGIKDTISDSDIVIVCAPKTRETISMFDSETVSSMKYGSYLVNVSRGPLVSIDAVYDALRTNRISGFATDVFPSEPTDFSHPIYGLPNVIATPHVAAFNPIARQRCLDFVVQNIEMFKSDNTIANIVDHSLGY
jgi:phosphoglycerate dehydrogenase-like enzyme